MKKNFLKSAAVTELKLLLPYYEVIVGLIVMISALLCVWEIGDYTLLTGVASGTLISIVSFLLMALTAEKALYMTEKSAKLALNGGYAARYIAMFIILGVLLYFKLINPVMAFIPLFVPKIGYTINACFEKNEF